MPDDPYEVLGVSREADEDEIKKAYRRLAFAYHPDHNPDDQGSEEQFKRVSWAYEVLSDPVQRRRWDRGDLRGGGAGFQPGDFSVRRGVEAFGEFIDMFGAIFSGGRPTDGPQPRQGEDLHATVDLELEEAMSGVSRQLEVPGVETCRRCGGDGAAEGADMRTCPECDGRARRRRSLFGLLEDCERCDGTGTVPTESCPDCQGTGRSSFERTITIEIPAGVGDNQTLRRAGQGAPGRFGGKPGDLLIEVRTQPHPTFERRGDDVHVDTAISFTKASLGGKKRVPTVEGEVVMTIPAGTSSGDTFRLKGRGFPDVRTGQRGNQYVHVVVQTPVDLTERQRQKAREQRAEPPAGEEESTLGERLRDFLSGTG